MKLVETWMHAQNIYALVIACMSARKKAPVNLLMCTFELYMFIGVSMQLQVVKLVLIPYCWSVALGKKIQTPPQEIKNRPFLPKIEILYKSLQRSFISDKLIHSAYKEVVLAESHNIATTARSRICID